jgi:hypothetical protein
LPVAGHVTLKDALTAHKSIVDAAFMLLARTAVWLAGTGERRTEDQEALQPLRHHPF